MLPGREDTCAMAVTAAVVDGRKMDQLCLNELVDNG